MDTGKHNSMSMTVPVIIATIAGISFGSIAGNTAYDLKLIGDFILRIIQIFVVFYVMATVADAVLIGDAQDVGRMSVHTFKWIMIFTSISAGIGAGLSILLKPGENVSLAGSETVDKLTTTSSGVLTINNQMLSKTISFFTEGSMVPFLILALFFGIAMGAYAKESQNQKIVSYIRLTYNGAEFLMKKVLLVVPICIFCLITYSVSQNLGNVIQPMHKFLLLLIIGDLIQFLIFIPLTGYLTKINPYKLIRKFSTLSFWALTTTSGSVCLPIKIKEEINRFGISKKVANFTGPITMCMNSCGAVQCYVAAIFFMAQSNGIKLSGYQMGMALLLSVLMCMGTISIPGGSSVVYSFLAASLGLPTTSIAILISIDWIAGMLRTVMNVDVDVLLGMLVADKLEELDHDVFDGKKEVIHQ